MSIFNKILIITVVVVTVYIIARKITRATTGMAEEMLSVAKSNGYILSREGDHLSAAKKMSKKQVSRMKDILSKRQSDLTDVENTELQNLITIFKSKLS